MAQVPKQSVRDGFVAAAAQSFAEQGLAATTMAGVAERAGSSVGNLYKYFSSKQQLLDAAIPAELVGELRRRTRARMQAFGTATDVRQLAPDAAYHALADELLDYCFEHRAAVVVLLARAEGTPFASFAGDFVERASDWALAYARAAYPGLRPSPELRFTLQHAYRSLISAIAAALLRFPNETRARAVIALVTAHHQGGLKRLFETQGGPDAEPRHPAKSSLGSPAARPRARDAAAGRADPGATGARPGPADRSRRPRRRS